MILQSTARGTMYFSVVAIYGIKCILDSSRDSPLSFIKQIKKGIQVHDWV